MTTYMYRIERHNPTGEVMLTEWETPQAPHPARLSDPLYHVDPSDRVAVIDAAWLAVRDVDWHWYDRQDWTVLNEWDQEPIESPERPRPNSQWREWAESIDWDGRCVVCEHDWINDCHGDCTCLGCNAERQAYEHSVVGV